MAKRSSDLQATMKSYLCGTFEVMVGLGTFRNVDLFRQGLYAYRLALYTIDASKAQPSLAGLLACFANIQTRNTAVLELNIPVAEKGIPYRIVRTERISQDDNLTEAQAKTVQARVDADEGFGFSRAFRIKYNDQTVALNESIIFRIMLDVAARPDVFLEVGLLFYEMNSDDYNDSRPVPSHDKYTLISRRLLRLTSVYEGLRDMYPIVSCDNAFASVDATIHSQLIDFGVDSSRSGTIAQALFPQLSFVLAQQCPNDATEETIKTLRQALENEPRSPSAITEWVDIAYRHYTQTLSIAFSDIQSLIMEYSTHLSEKPELIGLPTTSVPAPACPTLQELLSAPSISDVLSCGKVAWLIRGQLSTMASSIFQLWNELTELWPFVSSKLLPNLRHKYFSLHHDRWGSCIFRETLPYDQRWCAADPSVVKTRERICSVVRSSRSISVISRAPIEDMTLISNINDHAVVFEQLFLPKTAPLSPSVGHGDCSIPENKIRDVIIFVHGYQGCSSDLRLFKNTLSVMEPQLLLLLSTANEFDTEDSIAAMGARLATEISDFIHTQVTSRPTRHLGRISFICHSLGGLIVRAALDHPALTKLLPHMYTYLALGSPHLGYINANALTGTGLWVLRRMSGSLSLFELSLLDSPEDLTQSYLYRLSQGKGLSHFRNVLLVASHQDTYVPNSSATCQITSDTSKKGELANRMAVNILQNLDGADLTRFHVNFVASNGAFSLDNLIGRAAHISFLDQPLYIQMLTHVYSDYFIRNKTKSNSV